MSTRTNIRPTTVINAVSMAADITSTVTILQSISGIGYAYSWTGTSPVGTISVQVSNDYLNADGTINSSAHWTTIYLNVNGTPATTIAVSGNSGEGFANIAEIMAAAIRTIYTAGSGTGTLTAIVTGKVM